MSSNPTNVKPVTFDDFLAKASALPHAPGSPCVIAVAGSSASGKTSTANKLVSQLPHAAIFSQDLFQYGKDFAKRKTSPYKWDDPENFALDECASALAGLKQGRAVTVPAFEVVANQRIGTETIQPSDYIVWEGIYALGSEEIRAHVDVSLFIDTPFLVRLLRRTSRFFATRTIEEIDDVSTPARQMLSFVWTAEKDFVNAQRELADYYIPFDVQSLPSEIGYFERTMRERVPAALRQPQPGPEVHALSWNGLRLVLKEAAFEVYANDTCLYVAPIPDDLRQIVERNFGEIVA